MENQNEVKQKKKMGCLPKLGIGLLVLVVIGIIFGDSESTTTHESTVADSQLSEGVKEEPKKEVEEEAKKEVEEEAPAEEQNLSDEEFQKVDDDVSLWTVQQGEVSLKEVEEYIKTKNLTDDDHNKLVNIMKDGIDFNVQASFLFNSLLESGKTEEEAKAELTSRGFTEDNVKYAEDNKVEPVSLEFKNALGKANDYLAFTSFSKSGLKDQLEFEGFSKESIDYAIENVSVDWKEQAAKKAEDYLKLSSFSKQGLKDQLEFEGFTNEEVSYGLEAVGY